MQLLPHIINLQHHFVFVILWRITHLELAKYFQKRNGVPFCLSNYNIITSLATIILLHCSIMKK